MHAQPVYSGCRAFLDGTSERLFRLGLSLPSGSALQEHHVERIEDSLTQFVRRRSAAA